ALSTLDDADVTILGRTIVGPAGTFAGGAGGDGNKEIQGIQVPGGTIITNAGNFTGGTTGHVLTMNFIDLSQPANNPSSNESVRIWDEAPTPASLLTTGPNAGRYLVAQGKMAQVYVVDYRSLDDGWTATGQVGDFCAGATNPGGTGTNQVTGPQTAHNNPAA